jgi:hypothetical protein
MESAIAFGRILSKTAEVAAVDQLGISNAAIAKTNQRAAHRL